MYYHTFNSNDNSNCKILILNNLIGQTEGQFEFNEKESLSNFIKVIN